MASLDRYRAKRDASRTPEPVPTRTPRSKARAAHRQTRFVIQEHHARSLHWDFRLERDDVLVSWAIPKGLPPAPKINHLAVHVEDHPLEYLDFSGDIPRGSYGAGTVSIWDHGTYECEKWTERDVKVTLHGDRVSGRYALFRTKGDQWMIHKMDPVDGGFEPVPEFIAPMLATPGRLPGDDEGWAYEFKWDGMRAIVSCDGGRVRASSRSGRDLTAGFPELRKVGEAMGARQALLDGEIVALDEQGRPSFEALQPRMQAAEKKGRTSRGNPEVSYMIFDLLHLDGHSTLELAYQQRRSLLEGLDLNGPSFVTPPSLRESGATVLEAARQNGLEGVVAKRLDSPYVPGRRSPDWVKAKIFSTQEVVIGGWSTGRGHREGAVGALLVGVPDDQGLRFAGKVGTGFTDEALADLARRLRPLVVEKSPFVDALTKPESSGATYVAPELVGEVRFSEWTRGGRLRQPAWRGLRPDKSPAEVRREPSIDR